MAIFIYVYTDSEYYAFWIAMCEFSDLLISSPVFELKLHPFNGCSALLIGQFSELIVVRCPSNISFCVCSVLDLDALERANKLRGSATYSELYLSIFNKHTHKHSHMSLSEHVYIAFSSSLVIQFIPENASRVRGP